MAPPGKLFVFEGPDGVGKTTLSKTFSDYLNATGIQCDYLSFPGRETGSLGRHIYELHHDPNRFGIKAVDPASLQLLHIAAHIDLIGQCILPKLAAGRYVVNRRPLVHSDRRQYCTTGSSAILHNCWPPNQDVVESVGNVPPFWRFCAR